MKKLLFSVMLIASTIAFTSAQNPSVSASPEASKWSLALKGGGTYFRITPTGDDLMNDASWGAGLSLERTANPLFGMGLDVSYLNFNRSTVTGATIDPTLFASVNVSNLLFPHREKSVWNIFAKVGAGVGIYNSKMNGVEKDGISPLFTGSIHPEVALGSKAALGLEVGARYYVTERLGGMISKDRFDDAMTAMLTLRFNLGADHVRTMTMDQYYPAPAPVVMQSENPYDDSQLVNRLDNLDRQNQNIQSRLSKLENDLRELANRPVGTTVNTSFDNIEFEFDSANLTGDSYSTLDQIASILKDNATWGTLKIKGHTDSTGPEAYNQTLSEARAASVRDYLVSQGVSESVVSTEGYGESQPIATNDTSEGRQANRRVEFEIVK